MNRDVINSSENWKEVGETSNGMSLKSLKVLEQKDNGEWVDWW